MDEDEDALSLGGHLRDAKTVRALLVESDLKPPDRGRVADSTLAAPELRSDLVVLFGPARAPTRCSSSPTGTSSAGRI